MSPSLGHATPVRGAWIVVVVALLGVAAPTRASAQVTGSDAWSTLAPVVAPDVARVLLRREGKLIRSEPGVTVEVVGVPRILRPPGTPRRVFRVRVPGRFAPRALPYVLEAGGDAVAVAVPAPNMRSVVALTDDASVLSGGVQLTYAGRPAVESRRLRVDSVDDRRTRSPSPGPYEVARKEYDFGDRAFRPTELAGKVEVRADVHYPAGLLDGPYPIVLFMHGNHASC